MCWRRVRLRTGGEQWILLHLEVQSTREAGFEARLARYHGGLFWIFGQRVVTLVVLADLEEGWLPREDVFRVADFESRLRFPICKLIDKVHREWQDDYSLPVQIARADRGPAHGQRPGRPLSGQVATRAESLQCRV